MRQCGHDAPPPRRHAIRIRLNENIARLKVSRNILRGEASRRDETTSQPGMRLMQMSYQFVSIAANEKTQAITMTY
ncbi:MAG: hypothetical protein NVSMB9_30150 [Isosphaeraceae bacterium]